MHWSGEHDKRPRNQRAALRCPSREAGLNDFGCSGRAAAGALLARQNPSIMAPPPHPGSEGVSRRWDDDRLRLMEHCSDQDVLAASAGRDVPQDPRGGVQGSNSSRGHQRSSFEHRARGLEAQEMATRFAWFCRSSIGRPTGTVQMQLAHRDSANQQLNGKSNGMGQSAIGEPGRDHHLRMKAHPGAAPRTTDPP